MIRLAAALVLIWSTAASAQTATVRGGEHADFTRLVFLTRQASGWSVTAVPGGWEVGFPSGPSRFDTTPALRLISHQRVSALETRDGKIWISSDCECHVRRWLFNGNPVVDIHDGAARPGHGDVARIEPPTEEIRAPAPPIASEAIEAPAGLREAVRDASRKGGELSSATPKDLADLAEARRRADELEASLRGALDRPAVESPSHAGYGFASGSDAPLDNENGLQVHLPKPPPFGATADGRACPDPRLVDPAGWVRDATAQPNFALANSGMVKEFDTWDFPAVRATSTYYLYFGFGVEARRLLGLIDDPEPDLIQISRLLDQEPEEPGQPSLARWRSCPSIFGLWSLLVDPLPEPGDPVAAAEVVLQYQSLPRHLRILVGPRLVSALLAAGRTNQADSIRNLLVLSAAEESPETVLVIADLETALGAEIAAAEAIAAALASGRPAPPSLLLKHAEQKLSTGSALTPDEASTLEALAFEHRLHDIGPELQKALALNEIVSDQFLKARTRLETKLRAQDTSALFHRLYLDAAVKADDAVFLRLALPEAAGLGTGPQAERARDEIADRLVRLGFPQEALHTIAGSNSEKSRFVKALALLKLAEPHHTLAMIEGLPGTRAAEIRAEAYADLGDLDKAITLFREAGLPDRAATLLLVSQDWSEVPKDDDPDHAAAAILAAGPKPQATEIYEFAETLLAITAQERATFELLSLATPKREN